MDRFTAKVAGRRHHSGELAKASLVNLAHEASNPIDARAVRVEADGEQLGYLERGLARMIAPLLDSGRVVGASTAKASDGEINIFTRQPRDRFFPTIGATLYRVRSSDGEKEYVVDPGNGLCTCPAGAVMNCRHQRKVQRLTRMPRDRRMAEISSDQDMIVA
jgi:hypothetical protein